MKTPITRSLLKFLIGRGYTHCFSKTECIDNTNTDISITLTPVKYTPQLQQLPKEYDTFFAINEEPLQMADGIDDTQVWLDLDEDLLKGTAGLLLNTYLRLKRNEAYINC